MTQARYCYDDVTESRTTRAVKSGGVMVRGLKPWVPRGWFVWLPVVSRSQSPPFSPFNDFIIQTCKCTRVTVMKLDKLFFKIENNFNKIEKSGVGYYVRAACVVSLCVAVTISPPIWTLLYRVSMIIHLSPPPLTLEQIKIYKTKLPGLNMT